ncbi:hypothetical protein KKB58_02210 [Patescibacteria group bacterium]|nr:hypothetical protein [Patescibacteria group bacterium]
MNKGLLILIIVVSILVIRFFGSTVFLWLLPVALLGVAVAFFYPIFVDEGRVPEFSELLKRIWKKFKKFESKFFKWLD